MNADLVLLVALDTGTGPLLFREGVMAMGRAFLCAGSKSVLMTLWPIHVDSSFELMKSFFEYRKNVKTKQESLREARRYIRKEKGYDHPYFWAAFVPAGEAD